MDTIKNQSFPAASILDWEKKAESALKGKTLDVLKTTTYEQIILKPLYTKQDELPVPDYPGGSDFRRGIFPLGYLTNDWKVAQRVSYQTPEQLKEKLLEALEKGQTAVSFEVTPELMELQSLLVELGQRYPFAINTKGLHTPFLRGIDPAVADKIGGYIAMDPLAIFAEEGFISEEWLSASLRRSVKEGEQFSDLRTILVNTSPYHNGGAHAVQELGIALAEGVFYLDRLQDYGLELKQILAKMIFQFSIGDHFFMEIAKLRAARVLWERIANLYGVDEALAGMHITAETSSFSQTIYDPHVNLLRSGNQAFAAVLGGVQYLHVAPFDELTGETALSERLARNIQLLLKEEAHLTKVVDPAGGSWYIEQLTNQLAEKAWEFFQRIEANGGILEVLKSNGLQQEINAVFEKKNQDVLTKNKKIIGTNVYANLDEKVRTTPKVKQQAINAEDDTSLKIEAISKRRIAESYEELRRKANQLGVNPHEDAKA